MAHYYEKTDKGVEPRHFVGVSSRPGELRPTRITDARKNGWFPSVTTVMGMLDKQALNDWRVTEHLKQAWVLAGEVLVTDSMEGWIERVKDETQAALDKAPKDGTDFHDSIEKWFNGNQEVPEVHKIACNNTYACVLNTISNFSFTTYNWITEKSFVHTIGFAGKVDLHCASEGGFVIDFKTKNTADKWKPGKMAYPEMAMQLAAYRVGLGLENARCANVFICLESGEVEFYEWGPETLDKQWANFSDLLRIWLRNAEYVPGSK